MWPFKKRKLNGSSKKSMQPQDDPASIGNLIVDAGIISQDEFEAHLGKFERLSVNQLLGEYLIKEVDGFTRGQLEVLLLKQKRLRGGTIEHQEVMLVLKLAGEIQRRAHSEVDTFLRVIQSEGKVK